MASPPPADPTAGTTAAALPAAAAQGFRDAASYDAHRPTYPAEAVDSLLSRMRLADRSHARILEVGAGTGKFTAALAGRHEGFDVLAVEPHGPMREQLLARQLRGVTVVDGCAERVPGAGDEWADGCVVAQAFHWFATEETLRELHRILKPEAVLGMIWNIEDYNKPASWPASTAWEQQLNDLVFSLPEDGHPRFRHEKWQDVFTDQMQSGPLQVFKQTLTGHLPRFSLPLGEDKVAWTVWLGPEALWSRLRTLSQVAVLKGQAKDEARARFDEILKGEDVQRNDRGEVLVHGHTYFAWTDRL